MMARERFNQWIEDTKQLEINIFNTAANSLKYHLETILNFFKNRLTNANAESFNSKTKLFRANLRGVIDTNLSSIVFFPLEWAKAFFILYFFYRRSEEHTSE